MSEGHAQTPSELLSQKVGMDQEHPTKIEDPVGDPVNVSRELRARNAINNQVQVYLAEFSSMRGEIMQLSNKQATFLGISFAVSGYAFTAYAQLSQSPTTYAVVSLVLCAFCTLFCDMDRAIIRNASYIEGYLRRELSDLVDDHNVQILRWEGFIRGTVSLPGTINKHSPFGVLFQGLLILAPAWISFIVFLVLSAAGVSTIRSSNNVTWHAVLVAVLVIGTLIGLSVTTYRLKIVSTQRLHLPQEWDKEKRAQHKERLRELSGGRTPTNTPL